jgi:hypothetical protein
MTADSVGRLLYTDCAPGTGRGSSGGFQIQAQSPGVDPQQASLAVSWLLYEAQNAWVADRRPVEDFPLGFAHARAEGYGTAQGRYLGKEAVGGRMGNHLADCLLTRDAEHYGTIRPAQLWRSSLWRAEPWPTRECPDFDGDLELGPLDLEAIADWVRQDDARGPLLARLLSVLEDPGGQRVVIVSADADDAMRWIAAATLLLPQSQALEVSFKVFSAAPLRAPHRVVAAPPETSPELRPGASLGVFVLDATTGRTDEVSVTTRAAFLAGKFAGDADPYDIIDATDLALTLSAGGWPQDACALHAAWALTRPGDPVTDPDELFRWLQQADKERLREHGPAIAEALLAGPTSGGLLPWLDTRITAGELEFDQDVVRLRLLEDEISGILAGQAAAAEKLPDAALTEKARRDAESALTSALLRGADGRIDEAGASRVLRLARRHGIPLEPPSPPVAKFITDFALVWLASPRPQDPSGWALHNRIVAEAMAELGARYQDHPSDQSVRDTLRRFIPYFGGLSDPANVLYWPLQAAAIKGMASEAGVTHLRKLLAGTERRRRTDPNHGYRAERDLQQMLLDWDAVNESIAVTIITEISGSQVNPEIYRYAHDWLAQKARRPDLELLKTLSDLGDRVPNSPPELAGLAAANQQVTQFVNLAASSKIGETRIRNMAVKAVREADPIVITLRAAEVINTLSLNQSLAVEVFTQLPRGRRSAVPALLAEVSRQFAALTEPEDRVQCTLWLFAIYRNPALSDSRVRLLVKELHRFQDAITAASGAKSAEKWRAEVRSRLRHDDELGMWDQLFPKHGLTWTLRG